eukprot:scaffold95086_cov25-Phaeocystis_antarctica.AAC.1
MASSQGDVRSSPMAYRTQRCGRCQNSRYFYGQRHADYLSSTRTTCSLWAAAGGSVFRPTGVLVQRWVDSAGSGRSPGRFLNDFFASFKQNWHTARPTAPRWKAHIETCQKTNRKRMRAVQAEGQGVAQVRACSCRVCCARGGQAGARAQM